MASDATEPGTVLVTGGAKRIGAAICRRLAASGAKVVIHAHTSAKDAANLAKVLDGASVQADLTDLDAIDGLLDAAAEAAHAPIDHVVNNASAFPRIRLEEMTYDDFDRMMRIHAWAPTVLARQLAAHGGRSVTNLLDTHIDGHDPVHFPYLVAKKTLRDLTLSLAKELAPVRVNAVAPGPILEPTDGGDDPEAALERAVKATVLRRAGRPEEVAEAVAYLTHAEYVTGQVLYVDGGRHLRT